MKREVYQEQKAAIYSEAKKKQQELDRLYALSNNPVRYGDIITDHYHTIKVEKISVWHVDPPCCIYEGIELKKDLSPTKRQSETTMYQGNIVKHIRVPASGIEADTQ